MKTHSRNFKRNFVSILFGAIGSQAMYVFMYNYSSIFFTDFLGLSAGLAGTIFMLSRVWDAINDPMCGAMIEKFNPKWGKIQTFMSIGGVITAIGLVMLFTVPGFSGTGRAVWGAASYNIVGMAFTAVTVATLLQMARGTREPGERVGLSISYSLGCSVTGIIIAMMITKGLAVFGSEDPAKGYQMVALLSAVLGLVFLIGSVILYRDQVSEDAAEAGVEEESPKVLDMIKAVLRTPSFLIMVAAPCICNLGYGIVAGDLMYYLTYDLQKPELMSMMLPAVYLGTLAGTFLAGYLSKYGKARMIQVSFLILAAGLAVRMITGDASPVIACVFYAISNIGAGMMSTFLNPCLVDCADYAEYKTGTRCQALALTGFTLVSKMAAGIGVGILGFFLQVGGYDGMAAVQTESAVNMIHLMQFWPGIIGALLGAVLLFFYKLDDKTMETARAELAERQRGEA